MIASTEDYRLGMLVGWLFGTAIVAGLWAAAAQHRRDHTNRDRARLDALARIDRNRGPR